jgi:hypothetical protein
VPTKLDLRKELKHLYAPSAKDVSTVTVPDLAFLMIDGAGDPNVAPAYQQAVEALYTTAYTLKFASKKTAGIDYQVMPLEGLWWLPEMGERYGDVQFDADKSLWRWTMMIAQPGHITDADVTAAIAEARRKKPLPAIDQLRFEHFEEGLAVQILHIGPYDAEKANIDRLHARIAELDHEPCGKHHEIYLSDPRRSAPEKLRTIIRQPMKPLTETA